MEKKLPEPIMRKDETTNPGRFIAERAMDHVYNLTSLGPRPVGSFENEVLAVNVLTKEIYSVIKKTKKVHRISFDIQKTSGAFPLMFLDGLTNVYRNVQNVIVKIGPLIPSPYSVLVNCHFDTVADSPGGSDDSASCAIMLEIFRVISQMEKPLTNNIIFLFNGAEESLLQASHGFITQHKWAKEIKAFINLEACGAGGREILFQAGPENPWLMQAYSESVPYPLATSLAQEIFQSGVIPGDTDYRIFRDFGNIPGLDFAWLTNGYVYHTKMDDAAHVPLGTLQRTGDNMLSLALNLVSAPYPNHHPLTGNLVFFDVLGAFIVRSSEAVASVLSISILCFSLYTVFLNSNKISLDGLPFKVYIWQMFICTCVVLLSWISSLFLTAATALLLSVLNRAMSWYSRPIWLLFLYIIPSLFLQFAIISGVSKKQNRVRNSLFTQL
ncbi:hypothetical protein AAG570_013230 [Ranatra chinensis]|uniref:FXNA-like protease n=1 Tax=Ranatra chinensis TaxID=642074 RepID=A0ABD0YGA6_9HEMI